MKIGFVTCVELGLACMQEIYDVGGTLELVITLQDDIDRNKSGRVYLDDFCNHNHISNIVKIRNVNDIEAIQAVQDQEIDWLFIIGWSQIAREGMLNAPKSGVLGMHPTLLPKGRGRASIPWAIIKGLNQTGVTLFKLDAGVDTGPILSQHALSISSDETATTLYRRVAEAHKILMRSFWQDLQNNNLNLQEQEDELATEWPGRKPKDGAIIPIEMTCQFVDRLVRAVTHPYPGAYLDYHGIRYTIWSGAIYSSKQHTELLSINGNCLSLKLMDGYYETQDWESTPI